MSDEGENESTKMLLKGAFEAETFGICSHAANVEQILFMGFTLAALKFDI